MLTFQFKRHLHRPPAGSSAAGKPAASHGFEDSKPQAPAQDRRGWFDSSADLKGGLQVQEDDLDSLPAELRDVFGSR